MESSNQTELDTERPKIKKLFSIIRNEGVLSATRKAKVHFISRGKRRLINNPIITYLGRKKCENNFSNIPIIIGGCGRSGTTLLLTILGAHPHIFSLPDETGAFLNWGNKTGDGVNTPQLGLLYRYIIASDIPEEATRWCEKTPRNVRHFGKILSFFKEEVKLLHIVRDGRDVMLSHHPKNPDIYWVSPSRWVNDVQAGLKFCDHPQVLTIKYEDLILSYTETMRKVCNFIGEEYTEELQVWFKSSNIQDAPLQKRAWGDDIRENQKLYTKSIGKWKKKENEERVAKIMKNKEVVNLLEKLGYLQ